MKCINNNPIGTRLSLERRCPSITLDRMPSANAPSPFRASLLSPIYLFFFFNSHLFLYVLHHSRFFFFGPLFTFDIHFLSCVCACMQIRVSVRDLMSRQSFPHNFRDLQLLRLYIVRLLRDPADLYRPVCLYRKYRVIKIKKEEEKGPKERWNMFTGSKRRRTGRRGSPDREGSPSTVLWRFSLSLSLGVIYGCWMLCTHTRQTLPLIFIFPFSIRASSSPPL